MSRISGRHSKVFIASPHIPEALNDNSPMFPRVGLPVINGSPWVELSDWIRSIDLNTSGETEQVTGLNKLAHERIRLLSDCSGTLNGTVGNGKSAVLESVRDDYNPVLATAQGNPNSPRDGDESAYILSHASNSDWTYDLRIEFGPPAGILVRLRVEVLITSFNISRADNGSLRFTSDFELAGGELAVWEIV